jgi:hypothetical protein
MHFTILPCFEADAWLLFKEGTRVPPPPHPTITELLFRMTTALRRKRFWRDTKST